MKIYELLEARKNPGLNPKISINQVAKKYFEKYGDKSFVSFTRLDKLGINPDNEFNTPTGIYAYPVSYVLKRMGNTRSAMALPFAGKSEYATFFTAENGVIDLQTFSQNDLERAILNLEEVFDKHKDEIDDARAYAEVNAQVQTPGGIFWALTMDFSKSFGKAISTTMWNSIFRAIGINGCIDTASSSHEAIIHGNEPTQAVFFKRPGVIKNEVRVYNKYSPDIINQRIKDAQSVLAQAKLKKENFSQYLLDLANSGKLDTLEQRDLDALSLSSVFKTIYGYTDDELAAAIKNPKAGSPPLLDNGKHFLRSLDGKRWKAFEPILLSDIKSIFFYLKLFKEPFRNEDFEAAIIDAIYDPESANVDYGTAVDYGVTYAASIIKTRWPELEKAIIYTVKKLYGGTKAQDDDTSFDGLDTGGEGIYNYARKVIQGRWEEAEPYIYDALDKRLYNRMVLKFENNG